MKRVAPRNGFTLVEMLIALVLFAVIATSAVMLLRFAVDAELASRARTEQLAATRRFLSVWTADLAQASPRLSRDEDGVAHAALEAPAGSPDGTILALTRGGWSNVDGAPRPSLQRVAYRWSGGKLTRAGYPYPDGAAAEPAAAVMAALTRPQLRFRTGDGLWRDRWDPQRAGELPVAIELTLPQSAGAPLRIVSVVGANYQ